LITYLHKNSLFTRVNVDARYCPTDTVHKARCDIRDGNKTKMLRGRPKV